jgi:hypothetical protein
MINKYVLYVLIVIGIFFGGYTVGTYEASQRLVKKETKQVQVVDKKNKDLVVVANEAEKATVIYKDRIVTKYKTITKEVVKYEQAENAVPSDIIWIPAEFVRVHDNAIDAANGGLEITPDTSEPVAPTTRPKEIGVRSGRALSIISENYEAYSTCRMQLTELQKYILKLEDEMNDPK